MTQEERVVGGGQSGQLGEQGQPSAQGTGSAVGQDALATQRGELARSLQQEQNSEDTLVGIVQAAIELIPGVEEGSISVVTARRDADSQAASSELPVRADQLQVETGEGPCLDAAYEQQTVRVADMRTEARCPRFARKAFEAGAGSMLSFQLYVEATTWGAEPVRPRTRRLRRRVRARRAAQ